MVSRNNVASMIIEVKGDAQKQNPRKMQGCCRYIESSMQNLDFISLRACKKICVNDILPMTIKGNYHDQNQQVCKRLPATTH